MPYWESQCHWRKDCNFLLLKENLCLRILLFEHLFLKLSAGADLDHQARIQGLCAHGPACSKIATRPSYHLVVGLAQTYSKGSKTKERHHWVDPHVSQRTEFFNHFCLLLHRWAYLCMILSFYWVICLLIFLPCWSRSQQENFFQPVLGPEKLLYWDLSCFHLRQDGRSTLS